MKTVEALKEIAWQVGIEEFVDDENEQELVNRMRGYINAGHEELGLDAAAIDRIESSSKRNRKPIQYLGYSFKM